MDDEDQPTVEMIEYADLDDEDQDDGQAADINANPANAVGQGPNVQNPSLPPSLTQAELNRMPYWNDFDWAFHAATQEELNMNHNWSTPPRSILSPQVPTQVTSPRDGLQTYLIRQQLCAGIPLDQLEPMDGPGSAVSRMAGDGRRSLIPFQTPAVIQVNGFGAFVEQIPPAELRGATMRSFNNHPWLPSPPISNPPENNGTTGVNGESSVLPNAPTMNAFIDPNALHLPSVVFTEQEIEDAIYGPNARQLPSAVPTEQEIEDAINSTNVPQLQQWPQLTPGVNGPQSSVVPNNQTMNTIGGTNLIQPQQSSQFSPGANGFQFMDTNNGLDPMQTQQSSQFPPGAHVLQYNQALNGLNLIQPQQSSQFPPGVNGLQCNQAMNTISGLNLIQSQQSAQFPLGANSLQYGQTMNAINGTNGLQPQQWSQFTPGANGLQSSVLPGNQSMSSINGTDGLQPQQWSQFTPGANGLQSSVLPGNQSMSSVNGVNGVNGLQPQQWSQFTPGANVASGHQPNFNQPTLGNPIANAAQGFTPANDGNNSTIDPALLSDPFPSLASSSLLPSGTQHIGSTNNVNVNAPQLNQFGHLHTHPSGQAGQASHPGMFLHAHPPRVNHSMDYDPARGWVYTPLPLTPSITPSPPQPMQPTNDPTQANQIGFIPHASYATNALPAADVNMANADNGAQQFMPTNNQTAGNFSGITYPNPPVMFSNNQFGAVQYPDPLSYGSQQAIPNPLAGLSQYWGTDQGSQQQIPNQLGPQYPFTTTAGPDQMMPGIITEVQFRDTTDSESLQASSGNAQVGGTGWAASWNQSPARSEGGPWAWTNSAALDQQDSEEAGHSSPEEDDVDDEL